MNRRLLTALIATSLACSSAHAGYWKDADGNPTPDTESRRTVDEFGGSLLLTTDLDWEKKWNTSPETIPHFREASVVSEGQKLFTLIFLANPKLSANQEANVTCDLKVTKPDGSLAVDQKAAVCLKQRLAGKPDNLYLAAPVIAFNGEPNDPRGVWQVEVSVKDNVRHVVLPLKAAFTLK
ncbi:hypothetical protein [Pseudomonas putida]